RTSSITCSICALRAAALSARFFASPPAWTWTWTCSTRAAGSARISAIWGMRRGSRKWGSGVPLSYVGAGVDVSCPARPFLGPSPTAPDTAALPLDEFRARAREVVDWIVEYLSHPERYPVLPPLQHGATLAALPAEPPDAAVPLRRILDDI